MTATPPAAVSARDTMGFHEFVAMMAACMALQAFAIDTMLPSLPDMGQEFAVIDANRLQWVVTAFIMGAGVGQIAYGPLSDWLGRRPVLLGGLGLYVLASLLAGMSPSLEWLILLRFAQGIASASSSVIPRSIVRDRYDGPTMARVLSIIFMVFLLVPILAPSLGQAMLYVTSWRGVFRVLAIGGCAVALWVYIRLPETLHPEFKRVPRVGTLLEAARFALSERTAICYTLAQTCMFGAILAYVSTVPQIFAGTFHRRDLMAPIFAFCAAWMGVAAFLNSRIVERVGMRRISHSAMSVLLVLALAHSLLALYGTEPIAAFAGFQGLTMACLALGISNFNAIAMQPMGAIAGSAASIQGFLTMIGGATIASLIGHQWTGSIVFLPIGTLCCGLVALTLVLWAEHGVLFRNQTRTPADTIAAGVDIHAS